MIFDNLYDLEFKYYSVKKYEYNDAILKLYSKNNDNFYDEGIDIIKNNKSDSDLIIIIHKYLAYMNNLYINEDKLNNYNDKWDDVVKKYGNLTLLAIKLNDITKYNLLISGWSYTKIKSISEWAPLAKVNFRKHLYKAAKHSNIEMFNNIYQGIKNFNDHHYSQNLDIKILYEYANKNKNNNTREYIKFIFKDCIKIYPIETIENILSKDKLDKKMVDDMKVIHSVHINNMNLALYQKIKWKFDTYFDCGYLKCLKNSNKDIIKIIENYMIDNNIKYHYPYYGSVFDSGKCLFNLNNFSNRILINKCKSSLKTFQYEHLKIIKLNNHSFCSVCFVNHLDEILNGHHQHFIVE